jgi:hypothetical protein
MPNRKITNFPLAEKKRILYDSAIMGNRTYLQVVL